MLALPSRVTSAPASTVWSSPASAVGVPSSSCTVRVAASSGGCATR